MESSPGESKAGFNESAHLSTWCEHSFAQQRQGSAQGGWTGPGAISRHTQSRLWPGQVTLQNQSWQDKPHRIHTGSPSEDPEDQPRCLQSLGC